MRFYFTYGLYVKDNTCISGFELVKQNQFAKISECSEEKDSPQAKNVLDLQIILSKMQRVLTKFREVIWLSFANETLSLSFFV